MLLAWVVYGSIDQPTGGYIYDAKVIDGLRALGHRVDLLSIENAGILRSKWTAGDLAQRITSLRPDAVIGDELCFSELASVWPRLPRSIARILLVHHLTHWESLAWRRRAWITRIESRVIASSDICIATSHPTAVRMRHEFPSARVCVVEPGADRLEVLPRANRESNQVRFLFVGAWSPRKDLHTLLGAFERANLRNAVLHLVGDPDRNPAYARSVRARIATSRWLRENVRVTGVVNESQLAQEYAEADLLMLPSRFEGYGMVLTEAVRAGVPVAATNVGAIPSVVQHGTEAILLLPGNISQWAIFIGNFCADQTLRESMQKHAKDRAKQLPEWQGTSQAFHQRVLGCVSELKQDRARMREDSR